MLPRCHFIDGNDQPSHGSIYRAYIYIDHVRPFMKQMFLIVLDAHRTIARINFLRTVELLQNTFTMTQMAINKPGLSDQDKTHFRLHFLVPCTPIIVTLLHTYSRSSHYMPVRLPLQPSVMDISLPFIVSLKSFIPYSVQILTPHIHLNTFIHFRHIKRLLLSFLLPMCRTHTLLPVLPWSRTTFGHTKPLIQSQMFPSRLYSVCYLHIRSH